MKMTIRLLITAFSLSILFSCSKSSKQGSMIPKDVALAVVVNGATISEKLPWEDVKKNALFQEMYADSSLVAYIKSALDNPDNTGIDTKNDLIFYMKKDSLGGYIVFKGVIKDLEKFKTFNTNLLKGNTTTAGDITSMQNPKVMAVWNKTNFAIIIDAPQLNEARSYGMRDAGAMNNRDFKPLSATILDLKKDQTLSEDKRFNKMMEAKGDVGFWMNMEELNRGSIAMAALSMMNINKLYEGSLVAASLHFDNGKISVDADSYSGKEMTALFKKYSGSNFDKEMISRIPGENIAMFFALNFKPEGLKEFIKLAGMEGLVNMGSAMVGFSLEDFIKAIKGDILFAMNMSTDSSGNPMPEFIFASSINDKPSFEKLINAGKKLGSERMSGLNPDEVPYQTNGKYFAIGNKKSMISQYFSANGNTDKPFMKDMEAGSMTAYADLQSLFNSIPENKTDSFNKMMLDATKKMWDKVIINGGEYKGEAIHQHMEIRLMDKTTNSLQQLNNYLGIMGTAQKKKQEAISAMYAE